MVKLMNKEKKKNRKLLIVLVLVTIVSFILGMLFISILSDSNQELVKVSVNSYFDGISKGNMLYLKSLYSILTSNLFLILFVWVIGISIIGVFFVLGILIFKSFLVGFSFMSILYTYGLKGILLALIYIIPEMFNLFIIFVLVYYSISFSVLLFNYLFRKKEYNRRVVVTRYLKILIVSLIFIIVTSFVSAFIIPNVLRIF